MSSSFVNKVTNAGARNTLSLPQDSSQTHLGYRCRRWVGRIRRLEAGHLFLYTTVAIKKNVVAFSPAGTLYNWLFRL